MVKAFFIHTLLPGRCTILYSRWYGAPVVADRNTQLQAFDFNTSGTPDTVSLSSRLTVDLEKISLNSSALPEDRSSVTTVDRSVHPRKQLVVNQCKEVQAQYAFRASVSGKSYENDLHRLNTDGVFPDLEQGYFRNTFDTGDAHESEDNEKVVLWMGALNTGFCVVCHKNENRMLAEKLLKLLIKSLQEYCRVFNHPTEVVAKPDRVALVIDQYLPNGTLLFLTHRGIRQFEKELERKMKTN